MSYWIVLLLGSPVYCSCWAPNWDELCHVEPTAWWLIMILSTLICGPSDDLLLCGARASAGPMMTNCFQSLCGGLASVTLCYRIGRAKFVDVVHWYLWPVFVLILCFLTVILYFTEVYFDIIYSSCYYHHQIGSIHLSHCYHIFPWLCAWDVCYIIFCHLLHIRSGKTGNLFSLLLCSLW